MGADQVQKIKKQKSWQEACWNTWCILSAIGIWPRFIEPNLVTTRSFKIPIHPLFSEIEGLKIVQLSDLHWSENYSQRFASKIIAKVNQIKPDLILFTGDFLSRSSLEDSEGLQSFLSSFHAPLGCYASFGNHDYDAFLTVNKEGEYDVDQSISRSALYKGFSRLFHRPIIPSKMKTVRAKSVHPHSGLIDLLEKTPFQLLHNQTIQIPIKNSFLNVCGIGEYMSGHFNPEKAFKNYKKEFFGVVLSHNPDSFSYLKEFPGELILSGHTHGGQINLPLFRRRFLIMENPEWRSGLFVEGNKRLFVNRGLGSIFSFRWFSPPEISIFTLTKDV
jgi:uncharacterized protein